MKNIFFFIVYTFTAIAIFPQSMVVQKNDGTNLFIDLNTIDLINFILPCPGAPTVDYAGKTYNTVLIGTQCWLKENLDIGTMINGGLDQTNNSTFEKYCYNDDPINCTTYGGLYQWNEAMQYVTTEGAKGICPDGWHLPKFSEFQTLSTTVGGDGNALKEIGQGYGQEQGTNTSGFSALLAGAFLAWNGMFSNLGNVSYFWSSRQLPPLSNCIRLLEWDGNIHVELEEKISGLSVRCLKN